MDLLNNFWQLFLLSAPWLMLGLLIAGLLNVYLPANFLNRHLGKEGLWTTIKAAFIGAPMPLCSCGVIPAAIGLRRAGASKSATTAFLVSTPETGVDSVSVSYVLLGPFMAIIRPIAAVCSAIAAGVLVGKDHEIHSQHKHQAATADDNSAGCCSSNTAAEVKKEPSCCSSNTSAEIKKEPSCCSSNTSAEVKKEPSGFSTEDSASIKADRCCKSEKPSLSIESRVAKFKRAIRFSCNKLLEDTMVWLVIGLFFAALVQTYVPESYLSQWGSGIFAMLVVILISIPMYICATASTPIAAGLLLSGVSPGAVLVFMLAGPATNIATLGVVGKELGKRAVFAYLTGVIGMALLFGFLTDYLVDEFGFVVAPMMGTEHEVLPHWLSLASGIILAILMLRLVLKMALKKFVDTGKSIA
ncbi:MULTISPECIES: SO_0444 family Cu/Zn efflux transporter [Pseudoalteromonas]|uniref:SO_0444 family Cu/Zn efflux transporter n=1 Tax=Pseudoalteromonas TaxID=53246 RepID=UPI0015FCAC45|nr:MULTISPECIES: SO_0444 family Cu/Zn efflux transporter [Pseudoalteromonas]QMW13919.1 SO_0444 family Cu/Zn efflux transporter [Pseudoalteromonas sp. MT33b]|tara:strand:+ start:112 stop:1353 length:1242 start_codon:yes stop_codon:yes gene_type:complete